MNQLCFEVNEFGLSFAVINRATGNVLNRKSTSIKGRIDEHKKEEAAVFLRENNLLEFDGEVSLSFIGKRTTLVPQVIFGETNAKDVFHINFGDSTNIIEHTRFFEQALVNVYEIDEWVKRFFVVRYPRIIIQHETTHVLRGIFTKNTFQPTIHIAPSQSHFTILAVSKNQLDFFNTFEYSDQNDILYYAIHASNNPEYKEKTIQVVWHSSETADTLLQAVQLALKNYSGHINAEIALVSKINHQLLCV